MYLHVTIINKILKFYSNNVADNKCKLTRVAEKDTEKNRKKFTSLLDCSYLKVV